MNNNLNMYQNINNQDGDRFFFVPFVPFLTGALIGGAAVGLTRPRPIYNVAPQNNQMMPNPNYPYGYSSYGYYYPRPNISGYNYNYY